MLKLTEVKADEKSYDLHIDTSSPGDHTPAILQYLLAKPESMYKTGDNRRFVFCCCVVVVVVFVFVVVFIC